ncbi:MAG TPA: pyridoxine 5'-phosphate synthase [Syntrophorhabdales bacterium]|nr:pyridoxine 5'-phosphate synthase [Syntrophorhabdales bacterium]
MPELMVNIDHIATLREARGIYYPEPVYAAGIVEMAGASGVIVHLREDRRHIKDRDVKLLREVVRTKLNLEMAATDEMIAIAREIRPEMATIVPEKRQELTTEGGLDVVLLKSRMTEAVAQLRESGIRVSLFIDPVDSQVAASKETGADMVELHTGRYSDAQTETARIEELKKIVLAARTASTSGLLVNAGHGLHYHNVKDIAAIQEIEELAIGHSIVARAVFVGLDRAVRDMIALIQGARNSV